MEATPTIVTSSPHRQLQYAQRVLRHEGQTLLRLAEQLGPDFVEAVAVLDACRGNVIVMGMGKAGLIGRKISATLCSTGTRSIFLHPAEAIHGDLGRVTSQDVVVALSMSGETEELVRVLPALTSMPIDIVALTSRRENTLGKVSRVVLELGTLEEACELGLAPSTSTTAMLAMGDALALTLSRLRGFTPRDFARYHPGGSLGRKLTPVRDMMRPLHECRVAHVDQTVREVFVTLRRAGRRTGAVMIVDDGGKLSGIFTDSDLARLLERQTPRALEAKVREVMTTHPRRIQLDELMPAAIRILATHQISELPVVDEQGTPRGLIDITDVISWMPAEQPDADGHPDGKRRDDQARVLPFPPANDRAAS